MLTDLCSCDYLKCSAGKEQQWWDHNTLLFRQGGEDVLSGQAFNRVVIRKPSSRASVPSQPGPKYIVKRVLVPSAPARQTSQLRSVRLTFACR